ncbi:MAG TPA: response regulator [Anaerolineae bacterium]|nr:response regulator [Anaerolineae bacterium]HQK14657.1 response regulator [Anaerolineae bacterium]
MNDQDTFCQQIRDALHHLYDYPYLQNHPLALRYWPEKRHGGAIRAQRLSRWLLEGIEALNPPGETVTDASRVRYYNLLVSRFVEEHSLTEILREFGYSRSQFFREQQKAITMLAAHLWSEFAQSVPPPTHELLNSEVERVLVQRESINPAEVVQGVLGLVKSLAAQHAVTLCCEMDRSLPLVYGSRTLLRQVLLKGLSDLISRCDVREICIRMRVEGQRLVTELITLTDRDGLILRELDLEPVQHLVTMMGGRWRSVHSDATKTVYGFDFPVDSEKILLVIEDNEGIIRVFEGYLAGSGYLVIGATTGEDALRLAREVLPTAITLDIMIPNQDGWEILQALKSDPLTQSIPVVICSILEDPELAYSLGAAAYLQKPISQAAILRVLEAL